MACAVRAALLSPQANPRTNEELRLNDVEPKAEVLECGAADDEEVPDAVAVADFFVIEEEVEAYCVG